MRAFPTVFRLFLPVFAKHILLKTFVSHALRAVYELNIKYNIRIVNLFLHDCFASLPFETSTDISSIHSCRQISPTYIHLQKEKLLALGHVQSEITQNCPFSARKKNGLSSRLRKWDTVCQPRNLTIKCIINLRNLLEELG